MWIIGEGRIMRPSARFPISLRRESVHNEAIVFKKKDLALL
jgi:hypothetical protein